MKQEITFTQYQELSEEAKNKWSLYCCSKHGKVPMLPNIGQLIEFLIEEAHKQKKVPSLGWLDEDLCDDLWKSVKEILEA